jgi:cellulose synthase/poly-beta-1,6-N-acetylglucosamine synthase-like glycosyltransferase
MFFSVIVPTYNEEKYIENCISSILSQRIERSEYEIIVSDASSSDNTCDLAKKVANVVVTKERGISLGRNRGAAEAKGDILVFVDADVTLDPDFLIQCRKTFSNSSVIGMTGIAYANDGKFLQRLIYRVTYLLVRLFYFFGVSLFPGLCVAYRREGFINIGGFREDFGIVEDLDLARRISRLGKCMVNSSAKAFVSTRRLENHLLSTVIFHIYCDIRYLLIGKAPAYYPKSEEIHSWIDIWKQLKSEIK